MKTAELSSARVAWPIGLLGCGLTLVALSSMLAPVPANSQAITIDKDGNPNGQYGAAVDRRFAQIQPTSVELSKSPLDPKTRLELERLLQSEQGFAMRPLPHGHKGLTIQANGKLEPWGEAYLDMVTTNGLCAKPGDRVVITDLKFDHNKMVIMLNGGPDAKHRFLRHIQIGTGNVMNPVVQDDGNGEAQGASITLSFKEHIPELTDKDVKALLAPLISFDVKTPIQAFTDTLPPKLKDAILNHHVMVGMTTDMVVFALGPPGEKIREVEGQMPFEEWIYGKAPDPVQFVRINGNRVIRVEIAAVGKPPQIFEKDEVEGLMRTDGTPLSPTETHTRTIAMGDTHPNPDTQAPAPPPSLRQPGDPTPSAAPTTADAQGNGEMKPVQFPKQKPDDYPDASNLPRTPESGQQSADAKPNSDSSGSGSKSQPSDSKTPPAPPSQPAQSPPPSQQ